MKLAPGDQAKVAPFTSTNRTLGIGDVLSIFGLTAFTLLLCLFLGFGVPRFVAYFEGQ
jgi:hypothetical protein